MSVRTVCPHCGVAIFLDDCPVVATNQSSGRPVVKSGPSGGLPAFDAPAGETRGPATIELRDDPVPDDVRTQSAAGQRFFGGRQVLWRPTPPVVPQRTRRTGWLRELAAPVVTATTTMPDLESFPAPLLARRACTSCMRPLPRDLDQRQARILAIAGLNGAGKTHYLAAALTQATRQQGLGPMGFTEFAPDEATASVFHQRYYTHLFRDGEIFGATPAAVTEYEPMAFRVTRTQQSPLLLLTHDISGEVLADFQQRAAVTPFLRRASALIFLVDPLEFDFVRARTPAGELPPARSIHQADLLAACLDELQYTLGQDQVPVAVAISKADILPRLFGQEFCFGREADKDNWVEDIRKTSREVRGLLARLGEHELLAVANRHPNVSFHAVSSLGATPTGTTVAPAPVRCLDPLAVVLVRLLTAIG